MGTETLTHTDQLSLRVRVWTAYLDDYSDPEENHYLYGYRIQIGNEGSQNVTLRSRAWVIIDSEGDRREVSGTGVLGRQPVLAPGGHHEYHSYCQLPTNFGTMEGEYLVETEDGQSLQVPVGRFFLAHNLREFDANLFRRGQVVHHRLFHFRAVVADYDLECRRDDDWLATQPGNPPRNRPWYHLLVDQSDAVAYVPEGQIEPGEFAQGVRHPLVPLFFDGEENGVYRRNKKTWDDLKKG